MIEFSSTIALIYCIINILTIHISLYIIKRFRRRCGRVKNRGGGGGCGGGVQEAGGRIILRPPRAGLFQVPLRPDYSKSPQSRIILSPPEARSFWVCSKFGFLIEVWVCAKFGFVRSLGLFEVQVCSTPPIRGSSGQRHAKRALIRQLYYIIISIIFIIIISSSSSSSSSSISISAISLYQ